MKANLFQPFVRGEQIEVQRVPGSGLGLALAKSIAHLFGGDVYLVESSLGRGSEFGWTLPVEVVAMGLKASRDSEKITEPSKLLEGLRLLVVDDSEDLQVLMSMFLRMHGATLDVCANGAEAVEMALASAYDMILMDIKMPVMSGFDATAALRKKSYTGPIVAVTAHAHNEDRLRCLAAGCDDYLSKPIEQTSLLETILRNLA